MDGLGRPTSRGRSASRSADTAPTAPDWAITDTVNGAGAVVVIVAMLSTASTHRCAGWASVHHSSWVAGIPDVHENRRVAGSPANSGASDVTTGSTGGGLVSTSTSHVGDNGDHAVLSQVRACTP